MSLRRKIKKLGRKAIAVHEKYVTRYARPVVAAGLSYTFGMPVGAAFTAATHPLHQYAATTGARDRGLQGLEARQKGRAQAKRTTIYSAVGVTAGGLAAVGAGAFGLAGQGAGYNALAGTVGSNAIWGGSAPVAGAVPGAMAGANLGAVGTPGVAPFAPAAGAVPGGLAGAKAGAAAAAAAAAPVATGASAAAAASQTAGSGSLGSSLLKTAVEATASGIAKGTSGAVTREAGSLLSTPGHGGGADQPGDPLANVLDTLRGGLREAEEPKSSPIPLIVAGVAVAVALAAAA